MARPDDTWQLGARVDRYRLDAELGRGGMGVVYAATDADTGRRVAIKTLLPHAGPVAARRFEREGEAQAKVDEHPNVVRVHAAGEAGGRRYLVMDLATGGDLATRLKKGPLPPLEAAVLARDLARGLEHVHARGVLHRDLKPGNVLFDERGTPRLVDFGVAAVDGAERLTRTGAVLGTLAYMAPEQLDGLADARADVYALGAVLFHLLTGRPPFETSTATAHMARLVMTPAPSPSDVNPAVPDSLARIVLRCLAKRPDERYATAADLGHDLDRALVGQQVEAAPAPTRSGVVVALAVAAFLLPIAGGLAWRLGGAAPPPPATPTTPVEVAAPPASEVDGAPPVALDDLATPRTLGLPTDERTYGCQWHLVNGSPAVRSVLGTLTLGPAVVADDGVVTCPGALSGLVVWGGGLFDGPLAVDEEHDFGADEVVRFEVTITPERALTVTGFERERRDALFALLPDRLKDNPGGERGGAWPGVVVRDTLTNDLLAHCLALSLPWTADAKGVAPRPRSQDGSAGDLAAARHLQDARMLLMKNHDDRYLSRDASFAGAWTLDDAGALVRCELNEAVSITRRPGMAAGVWWFLGPREELRAIERRRRGP